jgi:hypothetical protein
VLDPHYTGEEDIKTIVNKVGFFAIILFKFIFSGLVQLETGDILASGCILQFVFTATTELFLRK